MKRNEFKKLADKTIAELNKQLQEMLMELARKRQDKKVGRLKDTRSVSRLADDVARVKTLIKDKELVGESK